MNKEAHIDLLLKINPRYFPYLGPLVKWKILSVKQLYVNSGYIGRRNSFHKVLYRFEEENVIKSFKDQWTRNKYVYLTPAGEKLINHSDHQIRVCEERLLHDLRLSEIIQYLDVNYYLDQFTLEHEFYKKGEYGTSKQTPDARVLCDFLGKKKQVVGIELELTQKSKERVKEKMECYLKSPTIDYCLYIFTVAQVAQTYHALATESFSARDRQKFVFLTDLGIAQGIINLGAAKGFHGDRPVKFGEIFKGEAEESWWRR